MPKVYGSARFAGQAGEGSRIDATRHARPSLGRVDRGKFPMISEA